MNIEFYIAGRYLKNTRRKGFVSFISGISIVGLVLAVAALITVLSVMNGFHREIKERILSTISHATVESFTGAIDNWKTVRERIAEDENILGVSPYIEQYGLLNSGTNAKGVLIRGIEPALAKTTATILRDLHPDTEKSLAAPFSILIGFGLSQQLGVGAGEQILLMTPQIQNRQTQPQMQNYEAQIMPFVVGGIFHAGVADYDNHLAFIRLDDAQKLFGFGDKISGLRLQTSDIFAAKKITEKALGRLDEKIYYSRDWSEKRKNFIQALALEKRMIAIILSLILAIATFNIVSTMVMVVVDKKADIAILRTIGMTPARIVKIFFYQGLMVGAAGIFFGILLGILLAHNIGEIIAFVESALGFEFFPADIFYISHFPSEIFPSDILKIAFGTLFLVILSSIYPAKKAGRTNISATLRYE